MLGLLTGADGSLTLTTTTTGAAWVLGFRRAPTGELVVTTTTTGATWLDGFLRAPTGELVVEVDPASPSRVDGLARSSTGALAVTQTVALASGAGFPTNAAGVLCVSGLTALTAPVNTLAPAISPTTITAGAALTTTNGTWTGNPAPTFTYQWKKGGVSIGGATANTYTTVSGDAGSAITCVVTATNSQGSASATSNGVTPSAPASTYATAVLADTPLLYWRLGDASGTTAADSSGNSRPGTYANTPTLGVAGALTDADTAVTFASASSQRADSASPTNITDNVAIEFWVKLPSLTSVYACLAANSTNNANGYGIVINGGGNNGNPGLSLALIIPGVTYIPVSYTFADTSYHHVVFTRESGTWKVYVDGASKTIPSFSTTSPSAGTIANFSVAARHSTGSTFNENFNGTIDEVAIYAKALTAARVSAHFAAR